MNYFSKLSFLDGFNFNLLVCTLPCDSHPVSSVVFKTSRVKYKKSDFFHIKSVKKALSILVKPYLIYFLKIRECFTGRSTFSLL